MDHLRKRLIAVQDGQNDPERRCVLSHFAPGPVLARADAFGPTFACVTAVLYHRPVVMSQPETIPHVEPHVSTVEHALETSVFAGLDLAGYSAMNPFVVKDVSMVVVVLDRIDVPACMDLLEDVVKQITEPALAFVEFARACARLSYRVSFVPRFFAVLLLARRGVIRANTARPVWNVIMDSSRILTAPIAKILTNAKPFLQYAKAATALTLLGRFIVNVRVVTK